MSSKRVATSPATSTAKSAKYAVAGVLERASQQHANGAVAAKKPLGQYVRTDILEPDPDQPRLEFDEAELMVLRDSVAQYGVLQPLLISRNNTIIAGERRWRAAQAAGLSEVPVVFVDEPDSSRVLEMQFAENVARSDLSLIEKTLGAVSMIAKRCGCTLEEAKALVYAVRRNPEHQGARQVTSVLALIGVSLNTFANHHMSALNLPEPLYSFVKSKRLEPTMAALLKRLPDAEREIVTRQALDGEVSLSDVTALLSPTKKQRSRRFSETYQTIAQRGSVKLKPKGGSRLTLEFKDADQLKHALSVLGLPPEELEQDAE